VIKGQGLSKLMAESNCQALDINFISAIDYREEMASPQINEAFLNSPWYADNFFFYFTYKLLLVFLELKVDS